MTKSANLFAFTDEILNEKVHFLCNEIVRKLCLSTIFFVNGEITVLMKIVDVMENVFQMVRQFDVVENAGPPITKLSIC